MTSVRQPLFCPRADRVNGGKQTPINGPIDRVITWKSWLHSMVCCFTHCVLLPHFIGIETHIINHTCSELFSSGCVLFRICFMIVCCVHILFVLFGILFAWFLFNKQCQEPSGVVVRHVHHCPMTIRYCLGKQGVLFKQYACQPWMKAPPVSGWFTYYLFMR